MSDSLNTPTLEGLKTILADNVLVVHHPATISDPPVTNPACRTACMHLSSTCISLGNVGSVG